MPPKLYVVDVEVTYTVCVVAQSLDEAEEVALTNYDYETDPEVSVASSAVISSEANIPHGWAKSMPYGDFDGDELTCAEFLTWCANVEAEQTAEAEAMARQLNLHFE